MEKIKTYDPRSSALKKLQRSGKNTFTILQDNRNLILLLIYEHGSISRKQLADITGLKLATITNIVNELLSQKVIRENGRIDGGNGRSVQTFCVVETLYAIAIRMTAVYVKVAAYDAKGQNKYVKKMFFKTDDIITECLDIVMESIQEIEQTMDRKNILGISMGVEHRCRLIDDDYAVWDEKKQEYVQIGKKLHDLSGYRVFINCAINYSAYQLNRIIRNWYNLKHYHVMILINVSYEVVSSLIIDNEIIYGKNGQCGQIKDLRISCDNNLTYNDVLSVGAMLKRAKELLPEFPDSVIAAIEDLNIRDIIKGYDAHDPLCKKIYNEVSYYLGYCISELLQLLDPDVILVGDELPGSEEFLMELRRSVAGFLDEGIAQRVYQIMLERSTLNDPALTGAADFTFRKVIGEIGLNSCV